jgi:hypothetical protein
MDIATPTPGSVGPEHSGPAKPACAEVRMRVLAELQAEAQDVFASSGETVERFLCERRDEVPHEVGLPA